MGLDIYVRWDDISKEEYDAQFTGFQSSPESGYVRSSWPAHRFMKEYAAQNGFPNPFKETFKDCPRLEDSDTDRHVGPEHLEQLLTYQAALKSWLDSHPPREFVPADEDDEDDFGFFRDQIEVWIKLIDFVHQHIDRPGLAVLFH